MSENASDMGLLGAMLLVLGVTFLAVNLYMHRHGLPDEAPPPLKRSRRRPVARRSVRGRDRLAPTRGGGQAQVAHPVSPA
jgi:hypothetical protein